MRKSSAGPNVERQAGSLIRGEPNCQNSLQAAAANLKIEAYWNPANRGDEATMTSQASRAATREALRDIMMVSSFGFWAVLLGFVPVAAVHMLAVS
jgi:hypothetical protein